MKLVKKIPPEPNAILDYVLNIICDTGEIHRETIEEKISDNTNSIKDYINSEQNLLWTVLQKLKEDKYISEVSFEWYVITFIGRWFRKEGGYSRQVAQNALKEKRDRRSRIWTIILILSTVVSAIYYTLEFANHFWNIYPSQKSSRISVSLKK